MHAKLFGQIFSCLAFICAAFALSANGQGDVAISGSIGSGKLERGKPTNITITLTIPSGLHINSSRPLSKYAIPTKIKLSGAVLKFGAVVCPKGKVRRFSFSDGQIAVYEESATFRAIVIVPDNFKGNVAKIRAVVSYQSCTDEVCFQPRSEDVTFGAAVK